MRILRCSYGSTKLRILTIYVVYNYELLVVIFTKVNVIIKGGATT